MCVYKFVCEYLCVHVCVRVCVLVCVCVCRGPRGLPHDMTRLVFDSRAVASYATGMSVRVYVCLRVCVSLCSAPPLVLDSRVQDIFHYVMLLLMAC